MRRARVDIVSIKHLLSYLLVPCIEEFFDEPASNGLILFGHAFKRAPLLAASYPATL
jgi:hypothetical protein